MSSAFLFRCCSGSRQRHHGVSCSLHFSVPHTALHGGTAFQFAPQRSPSSRAPKASLKPLPLCPMDARRLSPQRAAWRHEAQQQRTDLCSVLLLRVCAEHQACGLDVIGQLCFSELGPEALQRVSCLLDQDSKALDRLRRRESALKLCSHMSRRPAWRWGIFRAQDRATASLSCTRRLPCRCLSLQKHTGHPLQTLPCPGIVLRAGLSCRECCGHQHKGFSLFSVFELGESHSQTYYSCYFFRQLRST